MAPDTLMLLRIVDSSHDDTRNGVSVNVFSAAGQTRPIPRGQGNIVQMYRDMPQVVVHKNSSLLVFDEAVNAPIVPQPNVSISQMDRYAVELLRDWWATMQEPHDVVSVQACSAGVSGTLGLRPLVTYGDARLEMRFVNMIAQVLSFKTTSALITTVYLTDYTENHHYLPQQGIADQEDIRPFELTHAGQRLPREAIFECTLWDEHAKQFAAGGFRQFDYIYLDNVTLKLAGSHGRLVGDLHGGRQGGIADPLDADHPHSKTLYSRRQAYLGLQEDPFAWMNSGTADSNQTSAFTRKSTAPKRTAFIHSASNSMSTSNMEVSRQCPSGSVYANASRSIYTSGLSDVRSQNAVVGWTYRFALLLSDADTSDADTSAQQLCVVVCGQAATMLLGGLLPRDLRHDTDACAMLQRRLAPILRCSQQRSDWCLLGFVRSPAPKNTHAQDDGIPVMPIRRYNLFDTQLVIDA
ncbi:hypothetical protein THASP1DRAFT_31839 [Thamnocephalis sphaerospora]|uniref:Protection of telomeres protein 1 ssDNA-binding domain-containing protein n=1 Tax=Thamnocephalis sphaerospora TaxID=78915 RepID=A0A4P9XKK4_9FUNG|nr:hypothetical protein THASP1DRAFT_31839 [Thamnocephalis sphaerospora]|eukprot:RKP06338.1 hypothetical protein THASP1DRAFT_31839 [Thamnocephalis sphaerospora]